MGQPAAAKSSEGGCSHGARAISVLDARHGGGSGAGGGRHGEPAEQAGWSSERTECSRCYRTRAWMADGGVVRVADPAGDEVGGRGRPIGGRDGGDGGHCLGGTRVG